MGWITDIFVKKQIFDPRRTVSEDVNGRYINKYEENYKPGPPPSPLIRQKEEIRRKEEISSEIPKLTTHMPVCEKNEISRALIKNAFENNDLLKNLDQSQLEAIVDAMYSEDYEANQNIITEGKSGSHLYVSAEGQFEVFVGSKKVHTFGPGMVFGEIAILYNTKRNATIKVLTQATVWVLKRKVFKQIMMRTRMQDIEVKVNYLRSIPLLKELNVETLSKISDLLEVEFFTSGHCIIRQGDIGDKFYIISGGSVRITKKETESDKEIDIGKFSEGKYFGELALLKKETRQATVTALAPGVECLVLDRGPFIQLLGNVSELKEKVEKLSPITAVQQSKEYDYIQLNELEYVGTLGVGGFGRVELREYKKNKDLTFALKYLKKCHVVEHQQEEHIYNEKRVMMASSECPFILHLYRTYHDNKYVYFLMEACLGGDVFTALRKYKKFSEDTARFMVGCVVEALQFLHERGIVYRDLKPENLLIDEKGYIKMIDFGFAKQIGYSAKTWTFAGTPEYLAPEIILNKGHDRAVDYWALGVFIHELIIGRPPFRGSSHIQTYNLILKGINYIKFPKNLTPAARDLMRKLCQEGPTSRIGYQKKGVEDIKSHKWFQGFRWDALNSRSIVAPVIPTINGPRDLSNYDKYPKDESVPPDETSGWDKDF